MTPVHLITGPLGSGKTTLLRHLLTQKPADERWGVLVNDFGTLGIDAALLPADQVVEVAGGCLCCSAQLGLQQGLNRLLRHGVERIFVESSGTTHPQALAMVLSDLHGVTLRTIIAVITPMQLTPERWQRLEPLRLLVTLADHLILNKADLADTSTLERACALLSSLPGEPIHWQTAIQGQVPLPPLLQAPVRPLRLLQEDASRHSICTHPHACHLKGLEEAIRTEDDQWLSIAYRFTRQAVFNRHRIEALMRPPVHRAKGLLRTGMAWNLLQYSDGQTRWTPHGWRHDSRLVVFWPKNTDDVTIKEYEQQLNSGITLRQPLP